MLATRLVEQVPYMMPLRAATVHVDVRHRFFRIPDVQGEVSQPRPEFRSGRTTTSGTDQNVQGRSSRERSKLLPVLLSRQDLGNEHESLVVRISLHLQTPLMRPGDDTRVHMRNTIVNKRTEAKIIAERVRDHSRDHDYQNAQDGEGEHPPKKVPSPATKKGPPAEDQEALNTQHDSDKRNPGTRTEPGGVRLQSTVLENAVQVPVVGAPTGLVEHMEHPHVRASRVRPDHGSGHEHNQVVHKQLDARLGIRTHGTEPSDIRRTPADIGMGGDDTQRPDPDAAHTTKHVGHVASKPRTEHAERYTGKSCRRTRIRDGRRATCTDGTVLEELRRTSLGNRIAVESIDEASQVHRLQKTNQTFRLDIQVPMRLRIQRQQHAGRRAPLTRSVRVEARPSPSAHRVRYVPHDGNDGNEEGEGPCRQVLTGVRTRHKNDHQNDAELPDIANSRAYALHPSSKSLYKTGQTEVRHVEEPRDPQHDILVGGEPTREGTGDDVEQELEEEIPTDRVGTQVVRVRARPAGHTDAPHHDEDDARVHQREPSPHAKSVQ